MMERRRPRYYRAAIPDRPSLNQALARAGRSGRCCPSLKPRLRSKFGAAGVLSLAVRPINAAFFEIDVLSAPDDKLQAERTTLNE